MAHGATWYSCEKVPGKSPGKRQRMRVCTLESEAMFASSLAQRLKGKVQSKGTQTLQTARAWLDELDGRPVFVVEAAFLLDPYAPYARSVETFSFDLESGLALRQQVRMQQKDGIQVGETLTGFQAEFLESLPADAAQQFDGWLAELHAYVNPSQTPPPPTRPHRAAGRVFR